MHWARSSIWSFETSVRSTGETVWVRGPAVSTWTIFRDIFVKENYGQSLGPAWALIGCEIGSLFVRSTGVASRKIMGYFLASKEDTALERAESPKPYILRVRVTQTACCAKDIDILWGRWTYATIWTRVRPTCRSEVGFMADQACRSIQVLESISALLFKFLIYREVPNLVK